MDEAIDAFELTLTGLTVFTEIATGLLHANTYYNLLAWSDHDHSLRVIKILEWAIENLRK